MNTEGGHPRLGVGARGRAVCFIIWELGEVFGAGTSNYSPSTSSSETRIQMRPDQVSGNRRTTNRETVTNGESAAARSPSQARRPAPGGGTELQRWSLPGGKRSARLGQAHPGGGGREEASWVRPCGGPGSSRRGPGWPPSPAPGSHPPAPLPLQPGAQGSSLPASGAS